MRVASVLLAASILTPLAMLGGLLPFSRHYTALLAAAGLIALAVEIPRRCRVSAWWFPLTLTVPPLVVCAIQILPLGANHHWLAPDIAVLGSVRTCLSIAPDQTQHAGIWLVALSALGVLGVTVGRGDRAPLVARSLVCLAAVHGAFSIIMAMADPDWPTQGGGFIARGMFNSKNHAGTFHALFLPLSLIIARREQHWWGWPAAISLALALLFSGSRGAIIAATLVCLPLLWTLLPRRRRMLSMAATIAGICSFLAVIGLQGLDEQFGSLVTANQAITVDNRIYIWQQALPLIADAGTWGSGLGSVVQAYARSGDTFFAPLQVNALHSDVLELALEGGWLGSAVIVAGWIAAGVALWRRLRSHRHDREHEPSLRIAGGALLGVLILGIYSCADFQWTKESVSASALLLLIIAWECAQPHKANTPQRTGMLRLTCMLLALCSATAAFLDWDREQETALAVQAQQIFDARRSANLDPHAPAIDAALEHRPSCAELAVVQARLALDVPAGDAKEREQRLLLARQAISTALRLQPGWGQAWIEAARLACADPDSRPYLPPLPAIVGAALRADSAWAYGQEIILDIARHGTETGLDRSSQANVVRHLLAMDLAQPPWFFPYAASLIGDGAVTASFSDRRPRLTASGYGWLAESGSLETWEAITFAKRDHPTSLPIIRWPLAGHTGALDITWVVPQSSEARRSIAEQLHAARIPLPEPLTQQLGKDGAPWSLWATSSRPDLTDAGTRERFRSGLASELYRPWAREWADRIQFAEKALHGETLLLRSASDPELVSAAIPIAKAPEQERLRSILEERRRPTWIHYEGWRSSWIWNDGVAGIPITLQRWTGVTIDGSWHGWRRGTVDLCRLADQGLHVVVLTDPP